MTKQYEQIACTMKALKTPSIIGTHIGMDMTWLPEESSTM